MSQTVQISDTAYQELLELAAQSSEEPRQVIERLIAAARVSEAHFTTDEWFRHLGMSDDEIREVHEQAEREDANS